MKASNKFRSTKTFSILAGAAKDVARIVNNYGNKLVSISHQHNSRSSSLISRHSFVLRVIETDRALVDLEVYVDSLDNIVVMERVVIVAAAQPDFSYSSRAGALRALSDAAHQWVRANFLPDRLAHGTSALFIGEQDAANIIAKIQASGLSVLAP